METLPRQQRYDAESLRARGVGRAEALPRRLGVTPEDLKGRRILEVGCGFGEHCAALRDLYDADVVGIDPWRRIDKGPFAGSDFYLQEDITSGSVLDLEPFDHIVSYDVLEHIEDPVSAIGNISRLLKPNGKAFLKYNLYRGASASHILHLIGIPWVHLLHTPEEIGEMMLAKTGKRRGPTWVNKLTFVHYLHYFAQAGLRVDAHSYVWYRISDAFLAEHWEKLKAYPRDDLDRNFMLARLSRADGQDEQNDRVRRGKKSAKHRRRRRKERRRR